MKTIKEYITYLNVDFAVTLCFEGLITKNTTFGLDQITLNDSDVDLLFVLEDRIILELEERAIKQCLNSLCD